MYLSIRSAVFAKLGRKLAQCYDNDNLYFSLSTEYRIRADVRLKAACSGLREPHYAPHDSMARKQLSYDKRRGILKTLEYILNLRKYMGKNTYSKDQ